MIFNNLTKRRISKPWDSKWEERNFTEGWVNRLGGRIRAQNLPHSPFKSPHYQACLGPSQIINGQGSLLQGILNWNLSAKPWVYNSTIFDAYQQEGNRFGSIRDFLEPLKSQIRSIVESADSLLMDVQVILTAEILHSSLEVMLLLEIGGYMNLWKLLYKYWHHSYFDLSNPTSNGRGAWGFNVAGQSESFSLWFQKTSDSLSVLGMEIVNKRCCFPLMWWSSIWASHFKSYLYLAQPLAWSASMNKWMLLSGLLNSAFLHTFSELILLAQAVDGLRKTEGVHFWQRLLICNVGGYRTQGFQLNWKQWNVV